MAEGGEVFVFQSPFRNPPKVHKHGVEIMYLCDGEVPYVCMETGSPFHEYASSMLQSALSSGCKADGLYTYCNDKRLNVELSRLNMKPAEYMLAQVKQPRMEHVKAVGGTKRSLLIGLVIGNLT